MDLEWKIDYYETTTGKYSVKEFIDGLDAKAKSKVANALDLLEEFGIKVGPPKVEKVLGTDLWELRIVGRDNIRIFYVAKTSKSFLLLHAFFKKKQKIDKKEIKIAQDRLKDYKSRNI